MDAKNRDTDNYNKFLVRGFPCNAAKDSHNFDNKDNRVSPMNDIFYHAVNAVDMFIEVVGRAPLGRHGVSQMVRGKAKYLEFLLN